MAPQLPVPTSVVKSSFVLAPHVQAAVGTH